MTKQKIIDKTKADPFAEREAGRYEQPIVSREFILQFLTDCGQPQTLKKLIKAFELEDEIAQEALRRRLRAMERDGQLIRNRRDAYGPVAKMDLVRGYVIGHADGFGFVCPDDGSDDLFLSARYMRPVFHGDTVLVRVLGIDRRGRREAAIVDVLERHTTQIVGRFFIENGVGFVVPDNPRLSQEINIDKEHQGEARNGQIVIVDIIQPPTMRAKALGKISEILGDHMAPGMEIEIALRNYQLPFQWPQLVEHEAAHFSEEVPEEAKRGREDLRDLPLVTIDGEDSRDFDDAVFCQSLGKGKGWRLLVAIADVSSYVEPGSALDQEALARGNSVYFPQQVIPMLPEILSNKLCSLNPLVDRLSLVCEMTMTADGKLSHYRFTEAVMRSHARLTYNQVAAMLIEGDHALCEKFADVLPHLHELYVLYGVLRKAREKRGAIDFDRVETRIVFGALRKIEKIVPVERNDAHKMIEEFMISANVAAARYLAANEMPVVYRVHQEPKAEKLGDLHSFLAELGLRMGGGKEPRAKDYAALISAVQQRPDHHLIETVLLRSLSRAVYSPDNIGHFGLALDEYTHFTSPIRRYPDLIVHRAIRHLLAGRKASSFYLQADNMQGIGETTSMTERRADEATRDVVDWLKCEYMLSRIDQEFAGIVTTVTSFGLFVELQDIYVEGLVHITELDNDYYHFDPIAHRLLGERSGNSYRLGDELKVKVAKVDLDDRKIDFVLSGAGPGKGPGKKGAGKKGAGKKGAGKKGAGKKGSGKGAAKKSEKQSTDKAAQTANKGKTKTKSAAKTKSRRKRTKQGAKSD